MPALAAVATVLLAGCGILEPTPLPSPSPSPSIQIDTSRYIGGVIDPAGTVWTGKDSGGDQTTLTLHPDGTVAVSYGENSYDYPGDTWWVIGEVLRVEIYLSEADGLAEYVGTWNPDTEAIDAVLRTTRSAKELTVQLTRE